MPMRDREEHQTCRPVAVEVAQMHHVDRRLRSTPPPHGLVLEQHARLERVGTDRANEHVERADDLAPLARSEAYRAPSVMRVWTMRGVWRARRVAPAGVMREREPALVVGRTHARDELLGGELGDDGR